jgi:hypothetical protein
VNELTNRIPKDGSSLSELLASDEFDPRQWRVREIAGRLVLERIGEAAGIPPGFYTPETLPPLSEKARKILASVDAVAPFVAVGVSEKAADSAQGITLEDDGLPGIDLSDEGLPGIDPDR